jgi:hypothetical protein
MTEDSPLFVRDDPYGTLFPETGLAPVTAGSVGLAGPFVAFSRPGDAAHTTDVVFGRTGGPYTTRTFASADVARVLASGHRVLVTGGLRSRLIDILTGAVTDLGHTYGALFGEYLATVNYDTGALTRKYLPTGAVQTIRAAVPGCTSLCVDEEGWQISVWGNEVAYAYGHAGTSPGIYKGLWDGTTGTHTSNLPMLTAAPDPNWYELTYWDGLLEVYYTDFTVKLHDLRSAAAPVTLGSFADSPMGIDGTVVAWRPLSDERVVVRDIRDYYASYAAEPRYLGGSIPAGFGPGSPTPTWLPRFFASQDVSWTLKVHSGGAAGPVVLTETGDSTYGEITPSWDGTDSVASPVTQGTYTWVLTATSSGPGSVPMRTPDGTGTSVSGTVYVSRTAPTAPATLVAPSFASDVSTTGTFPLSWGGAPAGDHYTVQRAANGGAYGTFLTTTGTSTSFAGSPGNTYRFRVAVTDAAGRLGPWSTVRTTTVPYDDGASGTSYTPSWTSGAAGGRYYSTQHYSASAGAVFTFSKTGTAIYLIGGRGPSYGQFQVSIDGGAYSAAIDSYSASNLYRKVLYGRSGLSNAVHTIRVRVVGTAGRPTVSVDAIAFLR